MPDMSVTEETSQEDTSPLKEAAPSNMPDMLATSDRSGSSAALWSTRVAPEKAASIDLQVAFPHRSMEASLDACSWPSRWMPG